MKKEDRNIKKIIKKRIELPNHLSKSNERHLIRIGKTSKPVNVNLVKNNVKYEIKDYGVYVRQNDVEYDVVIYISSYNRYKKIKKILNQLFTQKTKYKFKVILMNDGSTQYKYKYNQLPINFPDIHYLKNDKNGGKIYYWKTINSIWKKLREYKTHAVIQIDDDFILCDNFINILMDVFFKLKMENNTYMAVRYHYGGAVNMVINDDFFDRTKQFQAVDGGTLFDIQFIQMIEYKNISVSESLFRRSEYMHSNVWTNLNKKIRELGVLVYKTRKSLAWHDGNEDSKMHGNFRENKKINTINFIND